MHRPLLIPRRQPLWWWTKRRPPKRRRRRRPLARLRRRPPRSHLPPPPRPRHGRWRPHERRAQPVRELVVNTLLPVSRCGRRRRLQPRRRRQSRRRRQITRGTGIIASTSILPRPPRPRLQPPRRRLISTLRTRFSPLPVTDPTSLPPPDRSSPRRTAAGPRWCRISITIRPTSRRTA